MEINQLLDSIAEDADCHMVALSTIPLVNSPLVLPQDLVAFYRRCGGVELFKEEVFGFRIVTPQEFVPANPLLLGNYYLENKHEFDSDESAAWYLIARGTKSDEFITIDLNAAKNGYCYDSFWEVHATGNAKVVAKSFTELVERLHAARGTDLYWEHRAFNLGHARDSNS